MAYERICIVDRKEYRYCGRCGRFILRDGGEKFCCDNCKDIYNICSDYQFGRIDATEANERLKKVDISKIETLVAPLQKNIYDILSKAKTIEVEEKKQPKKKKKSSFYDEPVDVEPVNEDVDNA